MTQSDYWNTWEVAEFLRLFERDPRTGQPDPTRPDPLKVHGFAHRHPGFPKPIKLGKDNRYVANEVRDWLASQVRGGPSVAVVSDTPKRGRKAKAVRS